MGTPVYLKYWFFIFLMLGLNVFITLFIAVLVHELAHTYVAKKFNIPVDNVYLSLFYGAAAIDITYTPYKETILISIAGPISNLLLTLLGYVTLITLGDSIFNSFLETFMLYNFILFVFNILPIYPMDGGRITKAICQMLTKPSVGRKINGYITIVSSLLLCIFSIYFSMFLMSIFSLLFIYSGYLEIKQMY